MAAFLNSVGTYIDNSAWTTTGTTAITSSKMIHFGAWNELADDAPAPKPVLKKREDEFAWLRGRIAEVSFQ